MYKLLSQVNSKIFLSVLLLANAHWVLAQPLLERSPYTQNPQSLAPAAPLEKEHLKTKKYLGFAELCCQTSEIQRGEDYERTVQCDPLCVSTMRLSEENQRAKLTDKLFDSLGGLGNLLIWGIFLK